MDQTDPLLIAAEGVDIGMLQENSASPIQSAAAIREFPFRPLFSLFSLWLIAGLTPTEVPL